MYGILYNFIQPKKKKRISLHAIWHPDLVRIQGTCEVCDMSATALQQVFFAFSKAKPYSCIKIKQSFLARLAVLILLEDQIFQTKKLLQFSLVSLCNICQSWFRLLSILYFLKTSIYIVLWIVRNLAGFYELVPGLSWIVMNCWLFQ